MFELSAPNRGRRQAQIRRPAEHLLTHHQGYYLFSQCRQGLHFQPGAGWLQAAAATAISPPSALAATSCRWTSLVGAGRARMAGLLAGPLARDTGQLRPPALATACCMVSAAALAADRRRGSRLSGAKREAVGFGRHSPGESPFLVGKCCHGLDL